MEDQCSFDELSAMLDDEDFANAPQDARSLTFAPHLQEQPEDNSSDGDIDEDELDRLASLLEGDVDEPGSLGIEPQILPESTVECSTQSESSTETDKCSSEEEGNLPEKKTQSETAELPWPKAAINSELMEQGEPTKLEELRLMKERIRQLELELTQRDNLQVPSSQIPDSAVAWEAQNCPNSSLVQKPATSDKPVSNVNRTSAKSSVQLLEEDIFGGAVSSEDEEKSTCDVKESISHNKTSSSNSSTGHVSHNKGTTAPVNFYGKQKDAGTGHDSDSDWEGLDGEKPAGLNKNGEDLKAIMVKMGPRERVAHTPKYDPSIVTKMKKSTDIAANNVSRSWKDRSVVRSRPDHHGNQSMDTFRVAAPKEEEVEKEYFSGIRIIKPLVSGQKMRDLMEGRRMIRMSRLHSKAKTCDAEGDWVTVGVIVNKGEPKMSSKGSQYSVWKLCDLEDCDKVVSFFLFGNVHKQHWKVLTGTVIGLLNPSIMHSMEANSKYQNKGGNELAITVDNPMKVMNMGQSKDFAVCKSKTKAGKNCSNFINLQKGAYCSYHVQSAYKNHSAKRAEIQAGHNGVVPKSFEKQIFKKGITVSYQGQSFSSESHHSGKNKKSVISVNSLQQHYARTQGEVNGQAKVTTLTLHNLLPEDKIRLDKLKEDQHKSFHSLLSVPTAGSMNYVKHLKTSVTTSNSSIEAGKKAAPATKSISAKDLLKLTDLELKQKVEQRKMKIAASKMECGGNVSGPSCTLPQLGRGFNSGQDIVLDMDSQLSKVSKSEQSMIRAKQKAVAKIATGGGLKKENPNAVKKSNKSPKYQRKVQKRLAGSMEKECDENEGQCTPWPSEEAPPRKKSKFLDNLDPATIQQLINTKSKHDGQLTQGEEERQEEYFDLLEKKEQMESHMAGITEQKCTAVTCKQCNYRWFSQSEMCKEKGHIVTRHEAVKRFFKCRNCKRRTVSLDRLPTKACKGCGENRYERTTMLKEKNCPKLPNEELVLRGEERKFINSMK